MRLKKALAELWLVFAIFSLLIFGLSLALYVQLGSEVAYIVLAIAYAFGLIAAWLRRLNRRYRRRG